MAYKGLGSFRQGWHNTFMTIKYPDGTEVEAIVLSHRDDALRAAAPDSDEVLAFTRLNGVWISEDIEPVPMQFAWQRRGLPHVVDEVDCVCSKALASRLISHLLGASEPDASRSNPVYVFSLDGQRMRIGLDQLRLS